MGWYQIILMLHHEETQVVESHLHQLQNRVQWTGLLKVWYVSMQRNCENTHCDGT